MELLAVALLAATVAGALLCFVRWRSGGGKIRKVERFAAHTSSWVLSGAIAGAILRLLFLWDSGGEPDDTSLPPWLLVPLVGAVVGATMYLLLRGLLFGLSTAALHWATRSEERFDKTLRQKVRDLAWGTLGVAVCFSLLLSLAIVLGGTVFSFLLVALAIAVLPLFETWVLPWIQYYKGPGLAARGLPEIEAWLQGLRSRHRMPRFSVRTHEGLEKNAFATGGLFGNLVIVGGGLVQGMAPAQLKAVLAHEVAHVMRRDILRLLAPILLGSLVWFLIMREFVNPLYATSEPAKVALGVAISGALAGITQLAFPGYFSRRAEFGADRLAVELLGEGDSLIDALRRLHELCDVPLDRKTWSHPTTVARIDAIRKLG